MKTLIYSTIGGDYGYLQLFNLCFQTLLKRGEYSGDYIVFSAFPENAFISIKNRDKFKVINFPENGATWDKFSPFGLSVESNFPDIIRYDKVLYLNVDTIFFKSVYNLFGVIGEGITGSPEMPIKDSNYHGKKYFSEQDKIELEKSNQCGVNAGVLGFRPIRENLNVLKSAYKLYTDKPDGETHEQPAFNYCAWKANRLETTFAYPFIQMVDPQHEPDIRNICLAHFVCGISNAGFKINRMAKYAFDCM